MRRNLSYASSRINIARIGVRRVVYLRCIHFATCHVAATVTPPHLLIVAMDTSASFPQNFPTCARESANSRKFWQFRGHPRPGGARECVTFDLIPRIFGHRSASAHARAKTKRKLASTRIRFSRKCSRCRPRRFLDDSEGHFAKRSAGSKFPFDTFVCKRRARIESTTPNATDSRDRRGETETRQGRAHARHAYRFEPSQSRESFHLCRSRDAHRRAHISLSFFLTDWSPSRSNAMRPHTASPPPLLRSELHWESLSPLLSKKSRIARRLCVLRLIHRCNVCYIWMKYIFFSRYRRSRNTFPEFFYTLF